MSGQVLTRFARVNATITSIQEDNDWDVAENSEKLYFYQLRAAQNVNIIEPFTDEQTALMDYLTQRQAGRRLCDYAWRVFAQST